MKRMDVMNGYDHVRALLYAYPMAEMLARAVRDGAKVRAALSFRNQRGTLSVMESIAADMEYADRLLHWKEQLERAISYCGEEERFLLEYKYFRRGKHLSAEGAGVLACSERSYFRKQRELLEKLARRLARRGCTREAFYADFEGFSPLMRIVSALENGWERRLVQRRKGRGVSFRDGQNSSPSEGTGDLLPRRTKKAIAATAKMPSVSAAICQPVSPEGSASGEGPSGAGATVSSK